MNRKTENVGKAKSGFRMTKGLIALVVLCAVLLAAVFVMVLPVFRVRHVDIVGCSSAEAAQILEAVSISEGDHLLARVSGDVGSVLTLRYGRVESDLVEMFPGIEGVSVQVSLPSSVKISISKRVKIGCIQVSDGYASVDKEGCVLSLSDKPEEGMPVLQGLNVEAAVPGEQIVLKDSVQLDICYAILNAILLADREKSKADDFRFMPLVRSVRYVDSVTSYLVIALPETQKQLTVRVGAVNELAEKMRWLRRAASQGTFDELEFGILDMTGDEYVYRNT